MSIAKIKANNSARATFRYAVSKEGARVIGGNAAPWIARDSLTDDQLVQLITNATRKFMVSIDLNNRVKRAVGHTSIAFRPGEELDDQQMAEYCEKHLAAMILTSECSELLKNFNEQKFREAVEDFRENELHKYPYTIVRHQERHPHAHIIYSRINLETGRAIGNSFERYRSQEILRDLERQYQLEAVPNSWEVGRSAQSISQIEKEIEIGEVSVQKRLQNLLEAAGQRSTTVPEFIENAQSEGVEVRMQFTRTGKSKGISYQLDGVAFSGNSLGTRYSFKHSDPGLCKTFALDYDAERDNPQIQALCQRRPVTYDQRQQNILRDNLTASLSRTADAVQHLDFGTPAPTRETDPVGEPSSHTRQRSTAAARQHSDRPALAAREPGVEQFSGSLEFSHLPSRRGDRPAFEPDRERTTADLSSETEDDPVGGHLNQIDQQLREFEHNSLGEIQRINEQLANLSRHLDEHRARRLKQQQIQLEWAEEIAPVAERLFEYYAAEDAAAYKDSPSSTKQIYQMEVNGVSYLLSRDEVTNTYNMQREDTNLDHQAHQGITEEDVQNWRSVREWLEQQAESNETEYATESSPLASVPLTLDQADALTLKTWSQLTPRQQITLVNAAEAHRRTEPNVYVQVEQWVGQEVQLKRQLKGLSDRHREEQAALKELEKQGQRSLLNPFGASAEQLSDARESIYTTRQAWQHKKGDYDQVQERRNKRQQQESAHQKWSALPETEGMQRLSQLFQQPEVRSQYEAVQRRAGQLGKWVQVARSVGHTEEVIEKINEVKQAYLDGRQIREATWELMRDDLRQYEQQRQQELDNQLGL